MKKGLKKKKLSLNRDTVRNLTQADLGHVRGGLLGRKNTNTCASWCHC